MPSEEGDPARSPRAATKSAEHFARARRAPRSKRCCRGRRSDMAASARPSAVGSASAATASAKRSPVAPEPLALGQRGRKVAPGSRCAVRRRGRRSGLGDAGRLLQLGDGLLDVRRERPRSDGHGRPPTASAPSSGRRARPPRAGRARAATPPVGARRQSLEHARPLSALDPCLPGLARHVAGRLHCSVRRRVACRPSAATVHGSSARVAADPARGGRPGSPACGGREPARRDAETSSREATASRLAATRSWCSRTRAPSRGGSGRPSRRRPRPAASASSASVVAVQRAGLRRRAGGGTRRWPARSATARSTTGLVPGT